MEKVNVMTVKVGRCYYLLDTKSGNYVGDHRGPIHSGSREMIEDFETQIRSARTCTNMVLWPKRRTITKEANEQKTDSETVRS
jgi:hypothetical protein